jgi:glycosyltransferase involved in cell wall biosynthesis
MMLAPESPIDDPVSAGTPADDVNLGTHRIHVLVVGQTPPPYGGQALMVEYLVRGRFTRIQLHHLRLGFSSSMDSVGRAELRKVLHLLTVLGRAVRIRFERQIDLVWFAPAGPNLVPIVRDLVLLGVLRLLYPRIVLHFHAAGLSEFLQAQRPLLRRLALWIYGRPHAAIQTSALNPPDASYLAARYISVIPNGVPDEAQSFLDCPRPEDDLTRILYVGKLEESKGIMVLLESVLMLAQTGAKLRLWLMGQFGSAGLERRAREYCSVHHLNGSVEFIGQRVGVNKWKVFHRAHILCFPSFFESESFGNVLLEGMMFGLPIVATRWRGIPDVVDDGDNGLLVPARDSAALARALDVLISNPELRHRMGQRGRRKYLDRFTLPTHLRQMEAFLWQVGHSSS